MHQYYLNRVCTECIERVYLLPLPIYCFHFRSHSKEYKVVTYITSTILLFIGQNEGVANIQFIQFVGFPLYLVTLDPLLNAEPTLLIDVYLDLFGF